MQIDLQLENVKKQKAFKRFKT